MRTSNKTMLKTATNGSTQLRSTFRLVAGVGSRSSSVWIMFRVAMVVVLATMVEY